MSVAIKGTDRPRGGRPSATVLALAAALLVALGGIVWLLLDRSDTRDDLDAVRAEQAAAEDGLAAARGFLTAATSYSWREGEHDFDWLDQLGDDEVRRGIEGSIDDLRTSIVEERLTARGEVVDAAARVIDSSRVEVLAFVDQEIARADDDRTSIDQMRIVVTMRPTAGGWLVDDLVFQSGGLSDPAATGALD